jgi:hypothetical protein
MNKEEKRKKNQAIRDLVDFANVAELNLENQKLRDHVKNKELNKLYNMKGKNKIKQELVAEALKYVDKIEREFKKREAMNTAAGILKMNFFLGVVAGAVGTGVVILIISQLA